MTVRRPTDISVHDWQHQLIDERVAVFRAAPRRSGLDRIRRREAEKRAFWSLKGHLSGCHWHQSFSPFVTLDDLLAAHDAEHEEGG